MAFPDLAKPRNSRPDTCAKVLDSRKRRVRGLWQRNGRFFANLTVADDLGRKNSRMVPLNGASLDEAKADYARLTTERADDRLRPLGLTPLLADYITVHTQALAVSGKRASSVQKETACRKRILHFPSFPALRHAFRSWTCGDLLPRICHRPLNS